MVNEVTQIIPDGDVLREAKQRITKLSRRNSEVDFNEKLQDAIAEVWQNNQEARQRIYERKQVAQAELDYIRSCHDRGIFDDRYYSLLHH